MIPNQKVIALIPAKDAATTVADTVKAIAHDARVSEVIVIDDGSTDATSTAAKEAGAKIIQHTKNKGKAAAISTGTQAASDADIYLLIDADTGNSASAALSLLDPVINESADLVIGILPSAGKKAGFGLVNNTARWGIRKACGYEAVRPLSGQRAIRGELLRSLKLAQRYGMEVSMTIDAIRQGARVVEIPIAMTHKHTGRTLSGFLHRGRQGIDVVLPLIPRLLKRNNTIVEVN